MRAMLKDRIKLLMPGVALFVVLLGAAITVRSISIWAFMGLIFDWYGAIPLISGFAIIAFTVVQWRRNRIAGLSALCAPLLVVVLGTFPHPVTSPIGWAANVIAVIRHRDELQSSFLESKREGQVPPVGQIGLDGFGSLGSGLAYDPSGEIALPMDKRSESWNNERGLSELGLRSLQVHHIFGSYYHWFHP